MTVFEEFIDFLSALEYCSGDLITPVIVLNSVALKDRATQAITTMGVKKVDLYLDRDKAGRELTQHFQRQLVGVEVLDRSDLYQGHKDFNDFLKAKKNPK